MKERSENSFPCAENNLANMRHAVDSHPSDTRIQDLLICNHTL